MGRIGLERNELRRVGSEIAGSRRLGLGGKEMRYEGLDGKMEIDWVGRR